LPVKLIAAQFIDKDLICLFEFIQSDENIKIFHEKHYRLVESQDLSADELEIYKKSVVS